MYTPLSVSANVAAAAGGGSHSNASSASTLSAVSGGGGGTPSATASAPAARSALGAAMSHARAAKPAYGIHAPTAAGVKKALKRKLQDSSNKLARADKEKRAKQAVQRAKQKRDYPQYTLTPLNMDLYEKCTWPAATDHFYREIFVSNYTTLRRFQRAGVAARSSSDNDSGEMDDVDVLDAGAAPHAGGNERPGHKDNSNRMNVVLGSNRYGGCWRSALNIAQRVKLFMAPKRTNGGNIVLVADMDSWDERQFVHNLARDVSTSESEQLANIVTSLAAAVLTSVKDAAVAFSTVQNHPRQAHLYYNLLMEHAERIRFALSPVAFNALAGEKLHAALLRHLPVPSLAAYLEQLRALSCRDEPDSLAAAQQQPANGLAAAASAAAAVLNRGALLVDCLVPRKEPLLMCREARIELGGYLARKPLDPATTQSGPVYGKRIPRSVLFVLVPPLPTIAGQQKAFRRHEYIYSLLSDVVECKEYRPASVTNNRATVREITVAFLLGIKEFIAQVKREASGRKIFLVGWDVSALCNLMVAAEVNLAGTICFAYSNLSVHGVRGLCDDRASSTSAPTVFVLGDRSDTSCSDGVQQLRDAMPAETGLVLVGGADAQLRVCTDTLMRHGVTQSGVDRLIVSDVLDFVLRSLGESRRSLVVPYVPPKEENAQCMAKERIDKAATGIFGFGEAKLKPDAAVRTAILAKRSSTDSLGTSNGALPMGRVCSTDEHMQNSIDEVVASAATRAGQTSPDIDPALALAGGRSRQSSVSSRSTHKHCAGKFAWSGPAPCAVAGLPPAGCARHIPYVMVARNRSVRSQSARSKGAVATATSAATTLSVDSGASVSDRARPGTSGTAEANVHDILAAMLRKVQPELAAANQAPTDEAQAHAQAQLRLQFALANATCAISPASPSSVARAQSQAAGPSPHAAHSHYPALVAGSRSLSRTKRQATATAADAHAPGADKAAARAKAKAVQAKAKASRPQAHSASASRASSTTPHKAGRPVNRSTGNAIAPLPGVVPPPHLVSPNEGSARSRGYAPDMRKRPTSVHGTVSAQVVGVSSTGEAEVALRGALQPHAWRPAALPSTFSDRLAAATGGDCVPTTIQLHSPSGAQRTSAPALDWRPQPGAVPLCRQSSWQSASALADTPHTWSTNRTGHSTLQLAGQLEANRAGRLHAAGRASTSFSDDRLSAVMAASGHTMPAEDAHATRMCIVKTPPPASLAPSGAASPLTPTMPMVLAAGPAQSTDAAAAATGEGRRGGRIVYLTRKLHRPAALTAAPRVGHVQQALPPDTAYVMPKTHRIYVGGGQAGATHSGNVLSCGGGANAAEQQFSSKASVLLVGDTLRPSPTKIRRIVTNTAGYSGEMRQLAEDVAATPACESSTKEQKKSPAFTRTTGLEVEDDD